MTLETMQAVVAELKKRAVPATLEYPGTIDVVIPWSGSRHCYGDANETFDGDIYEVPIDDGICESICSDISSHSTDVQRIADFITCNYTTACGNAPGYAIPSNIDSNDVCGACYGPITEADNESCPRCAKTEPQS